MFNPISTLGSNFLLCLLTLWQHEIYISSCVNDILVTLQTHERAAIGTDSRTSSRGANGDYLADRKYLIRSI